MNSPWRRISSICEPRFQPRWPAHIAEPSWLVLDAIDSKILRLELLDKRPVSAIVAKMGNTLAIHCAITTHGSWLHGDPRGPWHSGRLIGPDPYLVAEARARMTDDVVVLNSAERALVGEVIGEVVREQHHRVFAVTIQPTHTHLVLAPLREDVKNAIARLKRRTAAQVLERRRHTYSRAVLARNENENARPTSAQNHHGQDGRAISVPKSLWTIGNFPVFIFDERHLANAIEYVRDHNRRAGIPADPLDWITPLFPASDLAGERFYRTTVCEELRW